MTAHPSRLISVASMPTLPAACRCQHMAFMGSTARTCAVSLQRGEPRMHLHSCVACYATFGQLQHALLRCT